MTEREALSDLVKAYRKVVGLEGAWDQELVNAEAVLKKGNCTSIGTLFVDTITVTLKYQMLHNLDKDVVYKIAKESEGLQIFTVPVYTGSAGHVPDFNDIPSLDYLVQPMYLVDDGLMFDYVKYVQEKVFGGGSE